MKGYSCKRVVQVVKIRNTVEERRALLNGLELFQGAKGVYPQRTMRPLRAHLVGHLALERLDERDARAQQQDDGPKCRAQHGGEFLARRPGALREGVVSDGGELRVSLA